MLRRVASALVLIPITLAFVFYAPPLLYLIGLGIVGSFSLFEYYQLTQKMGLRGQPWFGYAGFWILLVGLQEKWFPAAGLTMCLLVAAFLAAMWRKDPIRDRVLGMMANLLGIFYLGLCLYPAFALRYTFGNRAGLEWTLTLLAVIWTGDTAAFAAGKGFGRTRLAPQLSPNKTNEGAVAGLLIGVLVALLLRRFLFPDLPLVHLVVASLLMGIFGQLGDLAESMLKRAAGVKESSNLIPGHGGVLDRIDSLLFAFPILYLYLQRIYS
jgi:phosphatidate cytidylyltransferase